MMARVMRHAAIRVAQRHHGHFIPEQRAVLAVVAQQHAAGFAAVDGVAQPMPAVLLAVVRLQQPQIAARQFREEYPVSASKAALANITGDQDSSRR